MEAFFTQKSKHRDCMHPMIRNSHEKAGASDIISSDGRINPPSFMNVQIRSQCSANARVNKFTVMLCKWSGLFPLLTGAKEYHWRSLDILVYIWCFTDARLI